MHLMFLQLVCNWSTIERLFAHIIGNSAYTLYQLLPPISSTTYAPQAQSHIAKTLYTLD